MLHTVLEWIRTICSVGALLASAYAVHLNTRSREVPVNTKVIIEHFKDACQEYESYKTNK